MRTAFSLLMAWVFVASIACSPKKPTANLETTPITYRPPQTPIERTVGRLRRLAIAPVNYDCVKFLGYCTSKAVEENLKRKLLAESIILLIDWKGYDVVPIDPNFDLLADNLKTSAEQITQDLGVLAHWAMKSFDIDGSRPEVPKIVSAIGRALNVDGLLFIHAIDSPNPFRDTELGAVVYEVSSGRIVWSKRGILLEMLNAHDQRQLTEALLGTLEHAVPKILAENP